MRMDAHGNVLSVKDGRVILKLSKGRPRLIGIIDDELRVLNVRRNREKHVLRAINSYGFNLAVIENATRFDKILLKDNYGTFLIPLQLIKDCGRYKHFKKQGLETQVFLHINYLTSLRYDSGRNNL